MPPGKSKRSPRRILVTAGPTREMLDPVRFITNLSTGEMGYAIARAAREKGYEVTLISGPTALKSPSGVRFVPIVTVEELRQALDKYFFKNDLLIMAAAVGDFIPVQRSQRKIHRRTRWRVEFRDAPDLIRGIAKRKRGRLVIGFSLETENWLKRSRRKLREKYLDGIVANFYTRRHDPFGKTCVHVALIDDRRTRVLRLPSKRALAARLLGWAEGLKKYSCQI